MKEIEYCTVRWAGSHVNDHAIAAPAVAGNFKKRCCNRQILAQKLVAVYEIRRGVRIDEDFFCPFNVSSIANVSNERDKVNRCVRINLEQLVDVRF